MQRKVISLTCLAVGLLSWPGEVLAATCAPASNGCPTQWNTADQACECRPGTIPLAVCGRSGTVACDDDCSYVPGSATAASAELCNGCDDNLDGYVDNPTPGQPGTMSRSCTEGAPAGSGCVGAQACASGAWGTCVFCQGRNQQCRAETCNGADDNCNGQLDEGGVCEINVCVCRPWTCADRGVTCGTISNGCGGTLNCGTCSPGSTCLGSGACCAPASCPSGWCGVKADGCGGTLTCGCSSGQVCKTDATCCTPTTCAAHGQTCGTLDDGCGGTLHCGTCAGSEVCVGGTCVTPDPCAGCTTGGICPSRCIDENP